MESQNCEKLENMLSEAIALVQLLRGMKLQLYNPNLKFRIKIEN